MDIFDGSAAVGHQRIQELLLCFPCAVLDGVRWSVLCKAYTHRYPPDRFGPPPTLEETQIALADIIQVDLNHDGKQESVVRVQDTAVASHCTKDQLVCWPLLVKALVRVVQTEGSIDVVANSKASQNDEHASSVVLPHDGQELENSEVVGVLLSQVKLLLRQHWDATFDERAISFYSEIGSFVTLKKMKHFLVAVIKWVDQGRRCAAFLTPHSFLGDCLRTTMELRISQKNNDMILCCQKPPIAKLPPGLALPMAQDVMTPKAHQVRNLRLDRLEDKNCKRLRPVLVQAPMPIEAEFFVSKLHDVHTEQTGNFTFYSGVLDAHPIIVAKTGKGMENTAAATAIAIERYSPQAIINQGTAGGHDKSLIVGDIVLGKRTVNIGSFKTPPQKCGQGIDPLAWIPMDLMISEGSAGGSDADRIRYHEGSSELLLAARAVKDQYVRGKVVEGTIASANFWNNEVDRVNWFHERFGTSVEEMEGASAAMIAEAYRVPMVGIRVVSNNITNGGEYDPTTAKDCQEFVLAVCRQYISSLQSSGTHTAKSNRG